MTAPMNIGIVIRADGTVPFDEGVHPHVKAHIVQHLVDNGHDIAPIDGTPHYKIKNWAPPKPVV